MLLYGDLVPWYRLVDPPEDHRDEAEAYARALVRGIASGPRETLLDLGSGAGHNALHMKRSFPRCALVDLSEGMLALSRELHPEQEHHQGDMRTVRLGRTFDAVLVHDAVQYMTTEADLRAAVATAFVHTRPGGAAVFAPDALLGEADLGTSLLEADDPAADRGLRGLEWRFDPDPTDGVMCVEYTFLLRQGATVTSVHDRHLEGLFTRATWRTILEEAGFTVETFARPLDEEGVHDEVFLCRRPERGAAG